VMIGQLKQGAVALATDDGKQPAHLVLGEKGNCGWCSRVLAVLHESDSIVVLSDYYYQALGKYTRNRLTCQVGDTSYCRIGVPPGP
jgi:hypothetical protein